MLLLESPKDLVQHSYAHRENYHGNLVRLKRGPDNHLTLTVENEFNLLVATTAFKAMAGVFARVAAHRARVPSTHTQDVKRWAGPLNLSPNNRKSNVR